MKILLLVVAASLVTELLAKGAKKPAHKGKSAAGPAKGGGTYTVPAKRIPKGGGGKGPAKGGGTFSVPPKRKQKGGGGKGPKEVTYGFPQGQKNIKLQEYPTSLKGTIAQDAKNCMGLEQPACSQNMEPHCKDIGWQWMCPVPANNY